MNLKNKKCIGEGIYGKCYELSNGDILKIFKIPKGRYEIEKMKSFCEIDLDTIFFPKKLIINNNTLLGYTMKKAKGKKLYYNFRYCNLASASLNTVKLEKDIMKMTDEGIKMYDVHSENIIYDGINYSVIDTDEYEFSDLDKDYLLYLNVRQFSKTFIELFIEEILNESLYYDHNCNFFNKLRSYKNKDLELNQLIDSLKEEVENYFDLKIDRLCDLEKIKVIK